MVGGILTPQSKHAAENSARAARAARATGEAGAPESSKQVVTELTLQRQEALPCLRDRDSERVGGKTQRTDAPPSEFQQDEERKRAKRNASMGDVYVQIADRHPYQTPSAAVADQSPTNASCTVTRAPSQAGRFKRSGRKIQECRRVHLKYRDFHFDIEWNLTFGKCDCLEGLWTDDADMALASIKRISYIFENPRFYQERATVGDVRQEKIATAGYVYALCAWEQNLILTDKFCIHRDEQVGLYGFVFHRDREWI